MPENPNLYYFSLKCNITKEGESVESLLPMKHDIHANDSANKVVVAAESEGRNSDAQWQIFKESMSDGTDNSGQKERCDSIPSQRVCITPNSNSLMYLSNDGAYACLSSELCWLKIEKVIGSEDEYQICLESDSSKLLHMLETAEGENIKFSRPINIDFDLSRTTDPPEPKKKWKFSKIDPNTAQTEIDLNSRNINLEYK